MTRRRGSGPSGSFRSFGRPSRIMIWAGTAAALALLGGVLWWSLLPRLRVHVDPALSFEVDWLAFREAFLAAGVWRLELILMDSAEDLDLVPLGPHGHTMEVGLVARPGRNPLLTPEALEAGKTGPGHTHGRVAAVYPEEIARFIGRHREKYRAVRATDWRSVREHLFTNTAVHEVWHAVANSHSHNPMDPHAVMYIDPGRAAVPFGTRHLPFTRGHRERLAAMFAPVFPGVEDPFRRDQ